MSKASFSIEGNAAEPKQRVSQNGKHMLDVSVAHTPRRLNKQTNEWEDVKDRDGNTVTLWARATFFEDEADFLAGVVSKGTTVRLEGDPRLSAYIDKKGVAQASLEVGFAKLAIVPRAPRGGGNGGGSGGSGGQWAQPSGNSAQGDPGAFGGNQEWDKDEQPF